MKFATLALVAAVSANELHMFAPENWSKIVPIAMKAGGFDFQRDDGVVGKGTITFSQCSDPVGAFKLDAAGSSYSPNPFGKG